MARKMSRGSKRRLVLFGTLSIVIIFYFIFSVCFSGFKIYKLKHQEKVLSTKLNKLQKDEKNLSLDIEKLQDPEYLAKYAREAFSYSKEDGTPASKLPNQVHHSTKKSRYNKIMKLQQEISNINQKKKIEKVYETLIESKSFDGKYYIGRTYMDVADMDGVVYIENKDDNDYIGKFAQVEIIDCNEYDLIGKII